MIDHFPGGRICIIANELAHEPRNPLAFVHQELNVVEVLCNRLLLQNTSSDDEQTNVGGQADAFKQPR
jgi:hypothetical protein